MQNSNPNQSLDDVLLGGQTHAIELIAIAMEFDQPAEAAEICKLAARCEQDRELMAFLPAKKQLPVVNLRIEGAGATLGPTEAPVVDFQRIKPNWGLEWAVSLRPDFISCTCGSYTRWKEIKERCVKLLRPLAETSAELGLKLKAFGLQYSDVFRWPSSGDWQTYLALILKRDAGLLPSNVFAHKSYWHVHQGWFERAPRDRRYLNHLAVELTDEGPMVGLKVHGQHRVQPLPFKGGGAAELLRFDELESAMDELHMLNKQLLSNLLTPEVLKKIGVGAGAQSV